MPKIKHSPKYGRVSGSPLPCDRGMVFQSYALYPTMSVRTNISFGLKMAGVGAAERDRKVSEVAEFLQIMPLLDRKPSQLSGGQRQRVAIGRALAKNADIYLFDEPLSNLDAKLRTELRYKIRRLHSELGSTMIYVTHDQIEAMTLSTRIAVMKLGEIQQFGTPREIAAHLALLTHLLTMAPERPMKRSSGAFVVHALGLKSPGRTSGCDR